MTKFRGFIAIDIKASEKLLGFSNELASTGAFLKLVEPKNIHITLKFLGDTDVELIEEIENIIRNSIQKIKPFNIQLNDTGVFPNKNYVKVIWIGIKGADPIIDISRKIDNKLINLGFNKEKRPFSPHLTIARVKSAKNKEKLLQVLNKYKTVDFGRISVESINLKKSELTSKGPIYTTLSKIKFEEE